MIITKQHTAKLTSTEIGQLAHLDSRAIAERVMGEPLIRIEASESGLASARDRRERAAAQKREQRRRYIAGGMDGTGATGTVVGRKRTVTDAVRSESLSFSLDIEQWKELRERAERLELPTSDYIRMMLLGIDFCSDSLPHIAPARRERQINAALSYAARRQALTA